MTAVSPATADALEEAMQRLLEGRPVRTDGALTVANLAREAGVSRATANRATDILARFRARLDPSGGADLPAAMRDKIRIHGDATTLPPLSADLAVMTGNVAQVFLTDDEWEQTLRGIGAALRPGGHLAFETRRPEYRAWQEWAADTAPVTLDVPGSGMVEQ